MKEIKVVQRVTITLEIVEQQEGCEFVELTKNSYGGEIIKKLPVVLNN